MRHCALLFLMVVFCLMLVCNTKKKQKVYKIVKRQACPNGWLGIPQKEHASDLCYRVFNDTDSKSSYNMAQRKCKGRRAKLWQYDVWGYFKELTNKTDDVTNSVNEGLFQTGGIAVGDEGGTTIHGGLFRTTATTPSYTPEYYWVHEPMGIDIPTCNADDLKGFFVSLTMECDSLLFYGCQKKKVTYDTRPIQWKPTKKQKKTWKKRKLGKKTYWCKLAKTKKKKT